MWDSSTDRRGLNPKTNSGYFWAQNWLKDAPAHVKVVFPARDMAVSHAPRDRSRDRSRGVGRHLDTAEWDLQSRRDSASPWTFEEKSKTHDGYNDGIFVVFFGKSQTDDAKIKTGHTMQEELEILHMLFSWTLRVLSQGNKKSVAWHL